CARDGRKTYYYGSAFFTDGLDSW
nr:immunoglobulin heavy chain junction region [Macaca mulatta]MOV42651.1 immunoglobulin heavy chain junction region [Macaca mulatta]MOV45853.1 immunoglobulin heavy chain junction region [Macaca mulatta]